MVVLEMRTEVLLILLGMKVPKRQPCCQLGRRRSARRGRYLLVQISAPLMVGEISSRSNLTLVSSCEGLLRIK